MMKTKIVILLLLFFLMGSATKTPKELAIGSTLPMPDHKMEDVSGRSLTLGEAADQNGLLVIFSSNTCPWVMRWESRYLELSTIAKENEIGIIALNSNEEYRDRGDAMDDMIKLARKADYDFPYALDKDHEIADAFGASRTPHVFLFNEELKLVYAGAIDDNSRSASAVKEHYLKDAIEQLIAGEEVTRTKTESLGCTVKRVS